MSIFDKEANGEYVSVDEPDYYKIRDLIDEARLITSQLNSTPYDEVKVRDLFNQLFGYELDETVEIWQPFTLTMVKRLNSANMYLSTMTAHSWIVVESPLEITLK